MDFDALRTFITVVDQHSFTKASQKLKLSQPTVSFHIKNLEDYFKTNLIDRSPKHFHLTQTGELVYQRAQQVLGLMEKARSEVFEYQNQLRGVIHIGASYTVGEYILPAILKKFDNKYPAIDLNVHIDNTERVNRGIQLHEIDLGLVEGKVNQQGLTSIPFLEDEMVIIVPEDHPIREKEAATFQQLQDHIWISREEGSGTRVMMDTMLDSYNIRPKKVITIGSNHGVVQGVKEGLGMSLISKTVVEQTGVSDLIMDFPFIKPMTRFFSLVSPAETENLSKNSLVFKEMVGSMDHL